MRASARHTHKLDCTVSNHLCFCLYAVDGREREVKEREKGGGEAMPTIFKDGLGTFHDAE